MTFYSSLADTAKRLVNGKGRSLILTYKNAGIYSPQTDTESGDSAVQVDVFGAVFNYNNKEIDGTLIKIGDKKVLIGARDIDKPRVGDIITDNGQEFKIVQVNEIGPGDTPLVYNLQIRG